MFDLTLTFDNGPEPDITPGVIDVLARRAVRATFFVIGAKLVMPGRRALAERAHAEGHWIGNHSWTHSVPLGQRRDAGASEQEIGRTQEALGALAQPRKLFRPFGGGGNLDRRLLSAANVDYLTRGGFTCVLWNSVPRDWEDPHGWVQRGLADCAAQPWTLMVLHDLPTGALPQLDRFLGRVIDAGGRFRQDFPPDCLPIRDGMALPALEPYVTA
jgi:peptidoglycan/xylan/chitin deacetylase (PgdA/CDA1 family)